MPSPGFRRLALTNGVLPWPALATAAIAPHWPLAAVMAAAAFGLRHGVERCLHRGDRAAEVRPSIGR
jgi:hypothetical protein